MSFAEIWKNLSESWKREVIIFFLWNSVSKLYVVLKKYRLVHLQVFQISNLGQKNFYEGKNFHKNKF